MSMFFFPEDISRQLLALRQSNERLLRLAEDLGADARDINLVRSAIMGTLADLSVAFGLNRAGPTALTFPIESRYILSNGDGLER